MDSPKPLYSLHHYLLLAKLKAYGLDNMRILVL